GGPSTENPARTSAPDNVTTVTAPFVVVDDNGKVVMRVQGEGTGDLSRGIYVYGPKDSHPMAHVGIITSDGSGRLWASHAGATRPAIQVLGGGGDDPAQIAVFNAQGYNSLEEQGRMISNDQNF